MIKIKGGSAAFIVIIILLSLLIICLRFSPYRIGVNLTESLPQKIFLIKKAALPKRGDYVVFYKPNPWYQNSFVKKVTGVAGDKILTENSCPNFVFITTKDHSRVINVGLAKEYSLKGEKLTKVEAGTIPDHYYFVSAPHKDSLDSRYANIGLIASQEIIGVATPIDLYLLMVLFAMVFWLVLVLIRRKLLKKKSSYLLKINRQVLTLFLLLIYSLMIFSPTAFAEDLGVVGTIYNIKEKDLAVDIKNKLTVLEKTGKLAKLQKNWQQKTLANTNRPKKVEGLIKATATKEFIFDPSIVVEKDIFDHQNHLIIAKGKRINPLDYRNLAENLLFIDGDDPKQIAWAKQKINKHQAIIILTNGAIIELMRQERMRLYFDQGGFLVKTFKIQALPTMIYQDGKVLKVRQEVVL